MKDEGFIATVEAKWLLLRLRGYDRTDLRIQRFCQKVIVNLCHLRTDVLSLKKLHHFENSTNLTTHIFCTSLVFQSHFRTLTTSLTHHLSGGCLLQKTEASYFKRRMSY